jgi:hypothetical protein
MKKINDTMPIRFPAIVLIFTAILGGIIYTLHLQGFVTVANEVYARFVAIGLFAVGFLLIAWQKAKHHRFSWGDFGKNDTPVIVSFMLLLVASFVLPRVGDYLVAFVGVAAVVHVCFSRKFYPPTKIYYFIFLYALLMFFGTIGSEKGFHFPDRTLPFYVLPLSFCFFRFPKETWLKIADVFFKMTIVFTVICILYWWYNFLLLDANFVTWVTGKADYCLEISAENVLCQSAYLWANKWSGYTHPSVVSFVLFFG